MQHNLNITYTKQIEFSTGLINNQDVENLSFFHLKACMFLQI